MRLRGRAHGRTVAACAAVLSMLLVFPAASAAKHRDAHRHPHRHARPAGQPARQLRGVMLTPNWSIAGSPFERTADQQQSEISDACSMGANLIRLHVDWSQLQPGDYELTPPPADLPGQPPPQPAPQPPVEDPGPQPTGQDPTVQSGVVARSSLPATYKQSQRLPGSYDDAYLARLDQIMSWASACHIEVIANLIGSPCWSIDPAPCDDSTWIFDPPSDGGFQAVTRFLLARYPELYALEVWNEPNLGFWKGSPVDYAHLVNGAVDARNSIGSRTKIIAGGFIGDAGDFIAQLYQAGMRGQDGISVHPYSWTCDPTCSPFIDPARRHSPFRESILATHRVMQQYGDPAGLYLTEFGFATCPAVPACVSERPAGRWLASSLDVASRYRYIKGLTIFSLRDFAPPSDPDPRWDMRSGIMRADLTLKPAFRAVKRELNRLPR